MLGMKEIETIPTPSLTPEVFISHSTVDKLIADTICERLEKAGIGCWIAPRDVPGGSNYAAEITRALRCCRIIVFVFSRSSNESAAVQRELERAFDHRTVIIPFHIDDAIPSDAVDFLIASSQRIEAQDGPEEKHYRKLVDAVKRQLCPRPEQSTMAAPAPVRELDHPADAPKERSRRKSHWKLLALFALGAGAACAWAIFSKASASAERVEIDSPENGALVIGDDQDTNLVLRYHLPEKLNRRAEIEYCGEGETIERAFTSGNSYPIPDKQGLIHWRVRDSWTAKGGSLRSGEWTEWRSVTFYASRLAKILRTGHCVIGTADLSPDDAMTNYDPATNQPGGYEVELLHRFFASSRVAKNLPVKVEIDYKAAPEGWGHSFFHMLETDPDVDLLVSGITPTSAREKEWHVRFSVPSLVFPNVLVVRTGEPGLQNGEIVPKVIGVAENTANKDYLIRLLGPQNPRVYIDSGPKSYYQGLVARLRNGSIDAFMVDEVYIPTLMKQHPELAAETDVVRLVKEANPAFTETGAAYVLRPKDGEFLRKLNRFLEEERTIAEELRGKFFGD